MDKTELLRSMRDAYGQFAAAAAALSDDDLLAVPDGLVDWTRKDVLAHVEHWHRHTAASIAGRHSGVDPHPEDDAGLDIDAANERARAADRQRTADDVRRGLADSFALLEAAVATATADELFQADLQPWIEGTLAHEVLADTVAHYAKHAPHVGARRLDRTAIVWAIRTTHARIERSLSALSDDALLAEAPGMPGWTRKDVLAHIEWWHRHSSRVLGGLRSGVDPYPDDGGGWDIDTHNARVLAENRGRPAADVRAGEAASLEDLVAAVLDATDHELFDEGVQAWSPGTAARMVGADTWDHYLEHLGQLEPS